MSSRWSWRGVDDQVSKLQSSSRFSKVIRTLLLTAVVLSVGRRP
jgi:hypothetical protein